MPSLTSFSIIKIVYTEDRWDLMTICTVRKASSKGKIVYPWYIVTEFVLCERPAQNEELSTLDTLLQNLYCAKGQLKMKNCLPLIHCYRICTVRKASSKWRIVYPWYIVTEFVLYERPTQNEELSTLQGLKTLGPPH